MSNDGTIKSAILLMTLGEVEAAEVLKFLEPKEVQKVSTAMVALRNLSREQIYEVFEEFHSRRKDHHRHGFQRLYPQHADPGARH
jgi:flagellar motor switch protein FliG